MTYGLFLHIHTSVGQLPIPEESSLTNKLLAHEKFEGKERVGAHHGHQQRDRGGIGAAAFDLGLEGCRYGP